jgi:hypothetical protein
MLAFVAQMAITVLATTGAGSDPRSSYHIGNSLTWDGQPEAVAAMASQRNRELRVGYHIRCGSPLPRIAGDDETCVDPAPPFGVWRQALAHHPFHVITIQPHTGSTLKADEAVILEIIDSAQHAPAGAPTQFFIYQAWPAMDADDSDYTALWNRPATDHDDQRMVYSREYFEHLLRRVRRARPAAPIGMIPAGEVLAELDRRLKEGSLRLMDYQSAADFYRDRLHLSVPGRFVAGSTIHAVIHDEDPTGLIKPDRFYNEVDDLEANLRWRGHHLTPELQQAVQQLVWTVVTQRPQYAARAAKQAKVE